MPANTDPSLKYVPEHERDSIPAEDFAGPERTFPIRNQTDVRNAARLVGHAADPDAVKRKIISIAKRKGLTIPASWQKKGSDSAKSLGETLVLQGGAVKALGAGKVGGYAVLWSTASDPDLAGDFFRPTTKTHVREGDIRPTLYEHTLDPTLDDTELGEGVIGKADDVGQWVEAQLDMSDRYIAKIYELAEAGKLGWSTGSAAHMVRRERVGKSFELKRWPIVELTLTTHPCEPRAVAMPLKSWAGNHPALKDSGLGYDDSWMDCQAAKAAVDTLSRMLMCCVSSAFCCYPDADGAMPSKADRLSQLRAEFTDFTEDSLAVIDALMDEDEVEAKSILRAFHAKALSHLPFSDHSELVLAANEALAARHVDLFADLARDGRKASDGRRDRVKRLIDALTDLHAKSAPGPDPASVRLKLLALKHKHRPAMAPASGA